MHAHVTFSWLKLIDRLWVNDQSLLPQKNFSLALVAISFGWKKIAHVHTHIIMQSTDTVLLMHQII